ncbi:MAG: hypothetical protein H7Y03_03220 [Chitinophagaceae bacterium]|nr:hypothetical protein [Chitinophagaceae bacterium]
MKKQSMKLFVAIAMAGMFFTSCDKDDAVEGNDEEVITTMQLTFVPQGGGTSVSYKFDDADGPGGNNPVQDEIVLSADKVYNVTVQLLNKTESPVADITEEVMEESEAHRFYYIPTAGSNIVVSGLDNDGNGVPLGVTGTWTTTGAATGKIQVTLRHYPANPPNKAPADGVDSQKSGTDIEVEFNTKIQ